MQNIFFILKVNKNNRSLCIKSIFSSRRGGGGYNHNCSINSISNFPRKRYQFPQYQIFSTLLRASLIFMLASSCQFCFVSNWNQTKNRESNMRFATSPCWYKLIYVHTGGDLTFDYFSSFRNVTTGCGMCGGIWCVCDKWRNFNNPFPT